jgi:hypothetical protein
VFFEAGSLPVCSLSQVPRRQARVQAYNPRQPGRAACPWASNLKLAERLDPRADLAEAGLVLQNEDGGWVLLY